MYSYYYFLLFSLVTNNGNSKCGLFVILFIYLFWFNIQTIVLCRTFRPPRSRQCKLNQRTDALELLDSSSAWSVRLNTAISSFSLSFFHFVFLFSLAFPLRIHPRYSSAIKRVDTMSTMAAAAADLFRDIDMGGWFPISESNWNLLMSVWVFFPLAST